MNAYLVTEPAHSPQAYYVSALSAEMAIREAERLAGRKISDPQVTQCDECTFDPDLVLGYIRLARGEISGSAICPECGQEFGEGGVYVGFLAGQEHPEPFGPRCAACATQE